MREVLWGIVLVAITLMIHGIGMPLTVRVHELFQPRLERTKSYFIGVVALVVSSWVIIVVHLLEVLVWSLFFLVHDQFPNFSTSYYFALNEYTTLGSNYDLKRDWRLLEGLLGMAGLFAFAWSTGVLMTIATRFQDRQVAAMKDKWQKKHAKAAAPDDKVGG